MIGNVLIPSFRRLVSWRVSEIGGMADIPLGATVMGFGIGVKRIKSKERQGGGQYNQGFHHRSPFSLPCRYVVVDPCRRRSESTLRQREQTYRKFPAEP